MAKTDKRAMGDKISFTTETIRGMSSTPQLEKRETTFSQW
jgi:hypothetical protein